MFGTTEHRRRSAARAEAALRRATAWLGPAAARRAAAVAWNPSLPGGAKSEDTYLVSAGGVRQRVSISTGWPTEPDDTMRPPRPAVLEVGI